MAKQWYTINAKADKDSAEILIYDEIGPDFWGDGMSVGAKQFREDLKALGEIKVLNVRINSPGGDVFDGTAIYNTLRSHKAKVVVHIDGIAASIASVIAMAGDEIIAPANAMMMIHNPSGMAMGTAADFRKMADALDKVAESIVAAYARTGQEKDKLFALMEAETWMTAADAAEMGFVDTVTEEARYAANFDFLKRFRNAPEWLKEQRDVVDSAATYPRSYEDARRAVVNRRVRNTRVLRSV